MHCTKLFQSQRLVYPKNCRFPNIIYKTKVLQHLKYYSNFSTIKKSCFMYRKNMKTFMIPQIIKTQQKLCITNYKGNENDVEESGISKYYDSDDERIDLFTRENQYRDRNDLNLDELRIILYPNSTDPVLKSLSQCNSLQQVFDIVKAKEKDLTAEQASQAIVTIWDLHKTYERFGMKQSQSYDKDLQSDMRNLLEQILNHRSFQVLLQRTEETCFELNDMALSCILLYLYRVGLKREDILMQKLTGLVMKRANSFCISALSRLSVYLKEQGLHGSYIQSKFLPNVLNKIENCKSAEELKLLTICMSNMSLVTSQTFLKYKKLVEQMINTGILNESEITVIMKILKFLTFSEYSDSSDYIICRELMLMLKEVIPTMTVPQVIALNYYFRIHFEPSVIQKKVEEQALMFIEQYQVAVPAALLLCISPYSKKYDRFEEIIAERIDDNTFYSSLPMIFALLRNTKTSNIRLCNAFWGKANLSVEMELNERDDLKFGEEELLLSKIYKRYMYFNNNLGGTYRNRHLENKMIRRLLKLIQGPTSISPSVLARMVAFVIAYERENNLPVYVIERITSCKNQFKIADISLLSRGIQIAMAIGSNRISKTFMHQISTIIHALDQSTEVHLDVVDDLVALKHLTRGYCSRHRLFNTFLFDRIMHKHLELTDQLNSRLSRDIMLNLNHTKYFCPELIDEIVNYIVPNAEYVTVQTVEPVVSGLFHLGYTPNRAPEFFDLAVSILESDGNYLQGMNYVQVCLSLSLFGRLSPKLIHQIFNLSFLDKLDEEIAACYSKATYPSKVRHLLMELNRAVCIDQPEEKIPWFHEKYCVDLKESAALPNNPFYNEVEKALEQTLGGQPFFRKNISTPYHYTLDFEFVLDEKDDPVPVREYTKVSSPHDTFKNMHIENKSGFRRFAVRVHDENKYCINVNEMIGRAQLEQRHLEVLGYTVLTLSHFAWYSMARPTLNHKIEYIKHLISL